MYGFLDKEVPQSKYYLVPGSLLAPFKPSP